LGVIANIYNNWININKYHHPHVGVVNQPIPDGKPVQLQLHIFHRTTFLLCLLFEYPPAIKRGNRKSTFVVAGIINDQCVIFQQVMFDLQVAIVILNGSRWVCLKMWYIHVYPQMAILMGTLMRIQWI